jgi:hypothetical protein
MAHSALQAAATRLRDATRELELIAVEDRPQRGDVHLVDVIHNAAFELAGAAEQAMAALTAGGPHAVAGCHRHVNHFGATLSLELTNPERLIELARFGNHGRESRAWVREVVRSAAACQTLLWTDLHPALLACWTDLTDRRRKG